MVGTQYSLDTETDDVMFVPDVTHLQSENSWIKVKGDNTIVWLYIINVTRFSILADAILAGHRNE